MLENILELFVYYKYWGSCVYSSVHSRSSFL